MPEILYLEVPTPSTDAVRTWWQNEWSLPVGVKLTAAEGILINLESNANSDTPEADKISQISVFIWSVQRTIWAYLRLASLKALLLESMHTVLISFSIATIHPDDPGSLLEMYEYFFTISSFTTFSYGWVQC